MRVFIFTILLSVFLTGCLEDENKGKEDGAVKVDVTVNVEKDTDKEKPASSREILREVYAK